MLVPFGFLLPLFSDRFKKFYWTLSLGFLFTFGIEATQYITKRGIFEVDDIMNNWIGAIIGYSLVMFLLTSISKEKTKFKPLKLIIYLLPTLGVIFAGYKINDIYRKRMTLKITNTTHVYEVLHAMGDYYNKKGRKVNVICDFNPYTTI